MKPVIGLTPLYEEENRCLQMRADYMDAVQNAGGVPVILPLTDDSVVLQRAISLCNGILLTGGQDVAPELYGEHPLPECGKICPHRDRTDRIVFQYAMERDLPLLGICRGAQLINVLLGGKLWQDLPSQTRTPLTHRQQLPHDKPVHKVNLCPGTPLHKLIPAGSLEVNSLHHQGIRLPAPGTTVMAKADDGLIEAFAVNGKSFIWGIQWHPERMFHAADHARILFQELVRRSES